MTLNKIIERLIEIRDKHGELPVVVYDGCDPSDLETVQQLAVEETSFFDCCPSQGTMKRQRALCIRFHTN